MDSIQATLFKFFEEKGSIPGTSELEQLQCDYFQAGLLDSFGVFSLVTDMEEKFQVEFTADDFESPQFRTIGGLIEIISGKVNRG